MRAAFAATLALTLTLSGCRPLPTAGATRTALETVGYQAVAVEPRTTSQGSRLDVRVSAPTAEEGEAGKVAGVVWTTVPFRFDRLDVTVDAPGGLRRETFTYAQLAERYGPRLEELDRRDYGEEVATLTRRLLAGIALPGLVLAGGIGFSFRRAARSRPRPS